MPASVIAPASSSSSPPETLSSATVVAELAQQGRREISGAAELALERLQDRQRRIQADQVKQGQWPHGQAQPHSGRLVDVLPRGLSRFQQVHRVVEVGQ